MEEKKKTFNSIKNNEYDRDASFSAAVLRILASLSIVFLAFGIILTSINLITLPINYNNAKNDNTTSEFFYNALSEDSILFKTEKLTNEEIDNLIIKEGENKSFKYVIYNYITFDICLILLLIIAVYCYNFLKVKNLKDPFSNDTINLVKKIINISIISFIGNFILIIVIDLIFPSMNHPNLLNNARISIPAICGLYIIKYILETGQKKMKTTK